MIPQHPAWYIARDASGSDTRGRHQTGRRTTTPPVQLRALLRELIGDAFETEEPVTLSIGSELDPAAVEPSLVAALARAAADNGDRAGRPVRADGARYLVIVPRSEPALYGFLTARFRDDPKVEVLSDRRHGERREGRGTRRPERRQQERRRLDERQYAVSFEGVVVVRRAGNSTLDTDGVEAATWNGQEVASMAETGEREFLEDRQRVDRWLEEGQYLLGRIIPALLDDRERLRTKLEIAEQDCERLRLEVSELRKEIAGLQGQYRTEQVAIAEAFGGVMDLLGQLHKPLNDINRRLQPVHFSAANESPS